MAASLPLVTSSSMRIHPGSTRAPACSGLSASPSLRGCKLRHGQPAPPAAAIARRTWRALPSPAAAVRASASEAVPAASVSSGLGAFQHILVPVMDRNPHLNEATKQAITFATTLAKANADSKITVVVIDEDQTEDSADHKQRLDSIRFYLDQGGFPEYGLLERLGEGKMPAAVVGQVADDLELDIVVLPMEAVHHKHIDCNLLAEFTPCPVLLLPL